MRKYLRTSGIASQTIEGMKLQELANAYNDPQKLAQLCGKAPAKRNKPDPEGLRMTQELLAETIAKAITVAFQALPVALDEERVVELIREHSNAPREVTLILSDGSNSIGEVTGLMHKQTGDVLKCVTAGVNLWLAGPAGAGKTHLAQTCADALSLPFYSTGAVQQEYKLTGFINAEGNVVRTPFREAFEHGGVFLWDEVDGSSANALLVFNQALANDQFPFPDKMVPKHPDFIAIAAANTWGAGATAQYSGRNRIDDATLDRFVQVWIEYDADLERALSARFHPKGEDWATVVQRYRAAAQRLGLRHLITPRASMHGAKLMAAGLDGAFIVNALIRRGLDDATWSKLEAEA
ncbi:AAA family ATPase [Pseudomonas sp. PDM21]|uniref:AAA family ATPase n=1 Tax=Pseudomonas sp. PDM21 TaxID=2769257 RepID=UPI00177CF254|nr:AAA family ATPase [Pseudomonas sp. PDM21]MBD9674912.1 AAA family ATPase [Pseudomonas sp. PDM21]